MAIPSIIEQLIYASPQIIAAIVKMIALIIVRVIPATNVMVAKMFVSLHVAIVKWFYKIYLAAAVAIGNMSKMLWNYMQRAGKNAIDGFVSGILTAGSYIWQKVVGVFTRFIDAIKNFFGIHSPSTVFFNFGVDIIQGPINGILSIGSGIGNLLTSILSSAFSGIQSFLSSFAVVQISDGAVQTSGCTVRIKPIGVAEGDGGGTTAYSTDGVILYTPTQAETNYT